ncbi:hypothetical protein ACH347_02925 [Saccharopolyspora sp. 5N102]|uniref:hypothetical protein n=1 Tax=Saccharopolyspora sp. 5N102 TaxID=3375155 RepID=UPI0037B48BD6
MLATLRREGSALAGLSQRTLRAVLDIVVNNARLMREHETRVFDGDALFFTAAAPRDEDWLTRKAWAPYIGGTLENHDIDCLYQDLTQPERMDEIAEVLRARLR